MRFCFIIALLSAFILATGCETCSETSLEINIAEGVDDPEYVGLFVTVPAHGTHMVSATVTGNGELDMFMNMVPEDMDVEIISSGLWSTMRINYGEEYDVVYVVEDLRNMPLVIDSEYVELTFHNTHAHDWNIPIYWRGIPVD